MQTSGPGTPQLIAAAGGVLLIVSLFLPWAGAGDVDLNAWELWTMADVYFLIAGLAAIIAGATGGHFRFNPGLSVNGAADILNVVATMLILWLLIFDFPDGAGRKIGVFLALVAALASAFAAYAAAFGEGRRSPTGTTP